ncbi:type II/IV secretion system ATPase subunit [Methanoplanus limicola]|uniref:Type II secretion system protein E n=1 Tax=Methanoplanus limicola DSM 2279 TaxID=937775 RepID=H1Z236_9EURY|nr:type II/IV secretion system ATPase subunit [Methanoplanus limicola]EHQ36381.1 type II secretion system protein E [Methanoplanus limicola DSM 2279]
MSDLVCKIKSKSSFFKKGDSEENECMDNATVENSLPEPDTEYAGNKNRFSQRLKLYNRFTGKKSDKSVLDPLNYYENEYPEIPSGNDESFLCDYEELERYWLKPPFSYAVIIRDEDRNFSYRVCEPKISNKEQLLLEEADSELRSVLIYDTQAKRDEIRIDHDTVHKIVKNFDRQIDDDRVGIICYYLDCNFHGYGKLDALMHDENIEDITCNGPGSPVFIYHRKYSNLPVNLSFAGEELNKFVLKVAQKADKQLSLTTPLVDATLPDGARAQITYSDVVSTKGSSFTIRKFKTEPITPVDLIDYRTYDPEILAFIWLCVESRKSALVVGGTASGKTSTMNALSLFIPQFSKIVSIEDTREIQMPHKNWLAMKTRETVTESRKGSVDMFSLLKTALRQRPEYIIVGEVRGSEAQTLFQAMNTGHTTYSTLHAGGVDQAINRLTTDPINVATAMFEALDLIIIQQLVYIGGRMVRKCISLNEITINRGVIEHNTLYRWSPADDSFQRIFSESNILKEIAYSHGWSQDDLEQEIQMRKEILESLLLRNIRKSDEITSEFYEYSKKGRYEFKE